MKALVMSKIFLTLKVKEISHVLWLFVLWIIYVPTKGLFVDFPVAMKEAISEAYEDAQRARLKTKWSIIVATVESMGLIYLAMKYLNTNPNVGPVGIIAAYMVLYLLGIAASYLFNEGIIALGYATGKWLQSNARKTVEIYNERHQS